MPLQRLYFILFGLLLGVACDSDDSTDGEVIIDSPLVGNWQIAQKDVDLTSGPFGVLLAGPGSGWQISSNIGNLNLFGSQLSYTFLSDGKYEADYEARATFGIFQSYIDVVETGSYSVSEDRLTLNPDKYEGEGYFGNPSALEDINVEDLPPRTYDWATDGKVLLLHGICGEFQVETQCDDGRRNISGFVRAFRQLSD